MSKNKKTPVFLIYHKKTGHVILKHQIVNIDQKTPPNQELAENVVKNILDMMNPDQLKNLAVTRVEVNKESIFYLRKIDPETKKPVLPKKIQS